MAIIEKVIILANASSYLSYNPIIIMICNQLNKVNKTPKILTLRKTQDSHFQKTAINNIRRSWDAGCLDMVN